MASYFSKDALCPYYQYDDPGSSSLVCESFAPGSTIRSRFKGREAFRRHARKYCCDKYQDCTWYQIVSRTYENDRD